MSTNPLQRRRPIGPRARAPRPRSRRASVYILVLATAAIATAAGLGGLYIQRTHVRAARTAADIDRARVLASSGLEYAMARIEADASWRSTIGAGNWLTNTALGPGTLTVNVTDPIDANITNSPADAILIVSTATVGSASQSLSARISMIQTPHTALACGAYGARSVAFNLLSSFSSDGPVASGANMSATAATVSADAEAVGSVAGLTYTRSQTNNAKPRTVPTMSIAATWAAMGSSIPYASIPSRTLERVLLAPSTTVLGASLGPQGIYVIDCANGPLTVRDLRVYGTLVIRNCSDLRFSNSVRFDPIVPGYPSLVAEGPATFSLSSSALSESSTGVNFNPVGAPWQGATNATKTNTYTCGFSGIVLATGNITVSQPLTMTGSLISLDALTVGSSVSVTADPTLTSSPAPGFYTITPTLATTGVARVVN